jgi:hypothetical protein
MVIDMGGGIAVIMEKRGHLQADGDRILLGKL